MKTLGISMIVKNESECIEACLDSVKGADEIVICDTGSEDNTVELCKKYTDKVYEDYQWSDHFSDARNHALKKSTTDWILIIDADEELTDDISKIKKLLNNGTFHKYEGMTFVVVTNSEKIESCRVIRNKPDIRWKGAVHNVLEYKGSSTELRAKCYKTHFGIKSGYSPAHLKDPDRSMRILKSELEKEPDNTRYLYYLAREYINRAMQAPEHSDHVDKVIELLTRYDEIAFRKDWTNEYADALFLLALAYADKKDWFNSVQSALKSYFVLPSYKAPAHFLSVAMADTPEGMHNMPAHADHWKRLTNMATNANVAQIRPL